jgi:squalene-hopene/tetraprenyl-beta-curcumene cyclase
MLLMCRENGGLQTGPTCDLPQLRPTLQFKIFERIRMVRTAIALSVMGWCGGMFLTADAALGQSEAQRTRGEQMVERAIGWLRVQQDGESGGWAVNPRGPTFPAITGLVLTGMMMQPGIDAGDGSVRKGLEFLLSHRQADGGIYDRILPSYNTAICLSALSKIDDDRAREAIGPAQNFLRGVQFSEASVAPGPDGGGGEVRPVMKDHPFYGGVGYGQHGRPDLSNLTFFIQAMHDSGVPSDDPAFQRALVFLSRTQMHEDVNDMAYAKGSRQGGFIYATAEKGEQVRGDGTGAPGQSFAGMLEETLDDGTRVSRLRAYGSMTYAGFKSLLYANLPRDDRRVQVAHEWIRHHYTVEENPGLGTDGMYYYYITFARALDTLGEATLEVVRDGGAVERRDWAGDLIERLSSLQNEDGSFRSVDDRWMEDNSVLITAYAVIALQHAVRERGGKGGE